MGMNKGSKRSEPKALEAPEEAEAALVRGRGVEKSII